MIQKKETIIIKQRTEFMRHCSKLDTICTIVKDFQSMDKAIDAFRKLSQTKNIDINKKRWCIRKIERLQKGKKQFKEAQEFYNFVIEKQKFPIQQKMKAQIYKAFLCLKSWRLAQAQQQCLKIIKVQRNHRQANRCLIEALDFQIKVKQARQKLQQYSAMYPTCKWGKWALDKYNYVLGKQPNPTKPILNRKQQHKDDNNDDTNLGFKLLGKLLENFKNSQVETQDQQQYEQNKIPNYVNQQKKYIENINQKRRRDGFNPPSDDPYKLNDNDESALRKVLEKFKDFLEKHSLPLFS